MCTKAFSLTLEISHPLSYLVGFLCAGQQSITCTVPYKVTQDAFRVKLHSRCEIAELVGKDGEY